MKQYLSWKADGFGGGNEIVGLSIEFALPVPEWGNLEEGRDGYAREASTIVDLMQKHLPGGLTDAIFAELCRVKASVYRVPNKG